MKKALITSLGISGVLVILYLYLTKLDQFALNVPHWDDHAIRVFVNSFSKNNLWEGLISVFSFHNEHIIALTRLFALSDFWLTDELNFRDMIYFGNALLILLAGIFFVFLFRTDKKIIWYPIAAMLTLHTSQYENALWGMASIQNFGVITLSIFCFFLLAFQRTSKSKKIGLSFYAALLLAVAALLTSGNGILALPIGMLILIFQKKWKESGLWFIATLIILIIFFYNFPGRTQLSDHIPVLKMALFFVSTLGSLFSIPTLGSWLPFFGGLLILFLLLSLLAQFTINYFNNQKPGPAKLFLLSTALFSILTLLIVTYTRSSYGLATLLSSKYVIYSGILLLVSFLAIEDLFPEKWLPKMQTGIFCLVALIYVNSILKDYQNIENTYGVRNEELANQLIPGNSEIINAYEVPNELIPKNLSFDLAIEDPSKIDSISLTSDKISFYSKTKYQDKNNDFVVLAGENHQFFIHMEKVPQSNYLKRIYSYFKAEKFGDYSLLNFPDGIYQVYYLENNSKLYDAVKTLRITGKPYTQAPKNW